MASEVELKLHIYPSQLSTLLKCPLLQEFDYQKLNLSNTYYDTSDFELTKNKMALRVRQQGRRYIQTLKTQGETSVGLSQRQEFEWDLADNELDISLISEPKIKQIAAKKSFSALFTTNFIRHQFTNTDLEVAVDIGEVVTQGKQQPICELEIELKSNQVIKIFDLAIQLTQFVVLLPSDQSKAQTGYQLVLGERSNLASKTLPILQAEQSFIQHWQQLLSAFSSAWLAFTKQNDKFESLQSLYQILVLMQQIIFHSSLHNKVILHLELTWLLQQFELLLRYRHYQSDLNVQKTPSQQDSYQLQLTQLLHNKKLGYVLMLLTQTYYQLANDC